MYETCCCFSSRSDPSSVYSSFDWTDSHLRRHVFCTILIFVSVFLLLLQNYKRREENTPILCKVSQFLLCWFGLMVGPASCIDYSYYLSVSLFLCNKKAPPFYIQVALWINMCYNMSIIAQIRQTVNFQIMASPMIRISNDMIQPWWGNGVIKAGRSVISSIWWTLSLL